MKKLFIYLALLVIVIGCHRIEPLHIGSKEFTEQFILAEIIAQLLESENIPVKRSIPYGDTFSNLEAIKNGDLDLYVEYNGTGLIMLGRPPINDGDEAFDEVKMLFEPLGLAWLDRLGFANNYVLVMRRDRALALKIYKISDLIKIRPNIRMAMEPEFAERPLDGLAALQRRYGMRHLLPLVIDNKKSVIYQALLDGKVDVTEGFSTEGRIEDFGLMVLKDDLEFFPVYEPSPLVRADALVRYPQLRSVLEKLAGLIDTASMRQMNREVELEGRDHKAVATDFLIEHDLIDKQQSNESEEFIIAAGQLNELGKSISKALRAVRKTLPERRVKVVQTSAPLELLVKGNARLGILSAEAFFKMTDDFLPTPNDSIEAVGVIGTRMAHLITLENSPISSITAIKNLGVGPENAASDRTAKMVFTSLGLQDKITLVNNDNLNQQIEALKNQQLDGIFLMVPPGHELLIEMMNQGIFKLISINEWQQGNHLIRFPFFRLARIPATTYDKQSQIIETISAQMVLAGSTPVTEIVGSRGPATVISANVQPLSDPLLVQLSKALNTGEKLDPALPLANILKHQTSSV
ncbi:glycine betaine ABC transporter substrate-binding protein, partial [Candidatus Marithioploca araucensis]|nr:glycine betaine ABC transporter substrate-binding protein [Candidatus Marithioploca araucensis]